MKDVSVIISTYSVNRLAYTLACIDSLKKQSVSPREILLVLDPNEALIAFYKSRVPGDVKIVVSEGYGLSNARNAGVRVAQGEIVAFIDDDAVADENWLKNLVKNYDDPYVLGAGGLVRPIWRSGRPSWFPEELDWIIGCSYKGLPEQKSAVRNPIGCNMSFQRNVFQKVGYFKPGLGRIGSKLSAGEEMEFSMRVLADIPESTILYDPSSFVHHVVPDRRANFKYVLGRSLHEGYSKALITNQKLGTPKPLSTEHHYLRYLLRHALPSRLTRMYKPECVYQLTTLLVSIFSVSIGYIAMKMLHRNK